LAAELTAWERTLCPRSVLWSLWVLPTNLLPAPAASNTATVVDGGC